MAAIAVQVGRAAAQRAVPVIKRWLPRVAGGTGGVVVGEQIEDRRSEADKAKDAPLAKAEVDAAAREKCRDCPPLAGHEITKNFKEHKSWMDYQARVTGMRAGPLFLTEWKYEVREFDGFNATECLLMDAKAGYDQFFVAPNQFKYHFQREIMSDMVEKARKQHGVALPRPPVQLRRWYFQEPLSYQYMAPLIAQISPTIQIIHLP